MERASLLESPVPAARKNEKPFGASPFLARLLGLTPILEGYRRLPLAATPGEFARHALEALGVRVRVAGEGLESLPATGPLLLAANHPFGGVDGLILAALCTKIRPDLKIIVNRMLYGVPELRDMAIPVNVMRGRNGGAGNISGLRAAMRHMEAGGALAVFPAGVVSHWRAGQRGVSDPEWNALTGRLARVPGVSVVPLLFEGRNSLLFQAAGCVHPALRTMLLPREMWKMRGRDVRLSVGKAVEADILSALGDDAGRTAYIRAHCYALGQKSEAPAAVKWPVPVAEPGPAELLLEEAGALQPRVLAEEGDFQVFFTQGNEAPHLFREIGRLREETFRAVNEGSGKPVDIDGFDPSYTHLVLWDKKAGTVAGGYRVRVFFPGGNEKKLYSASLFRFRPEFFERCGISMELGRAFVAREYQRDYAPLLMLWKGIARLALRSGVRTLFGACSIGLAYAPESVLMLRRYLEEYHGAADLSRFVQGRRAPAPFSGPNEPHARGLSYKLLNRAVKLLEGGTGLPVLFKHYLQLGGSIAAFHEDTAFGTMDALMVVDLASIPEKILARYLDGASLSECAAIRPARVRASIGVTPDAA